MWLNFYSTRAHAVIPSAPVVPENDASVLFINSGMHPLVPYLMGQKHPAGVRLANVQKCIRTGDIDDVGDATHMTFFEMLGNWSLGDYFKKEKIAWSWEFLTDPRYLAIDKDKIFVTCFEGDNVAPRDIESAKLWMELGVPKERIFFLPKSENWWQLPNGTGPCGPSSETHLLRAKTCGKKCDPSCSCGAYIEIGNDVFMEFIIDKVGAVPRPAQQKNVDTGYGLERLLCMINGFDNVYESEVFQPAIKIVEKNSGKPYPSRADFCSETKAFRVLVEHLRTAVVIIADGVTPNNTGQGYVLRRLIRRAVRFAHQLGCRADVYPALLDNFIKFLGEFYPEIILSKDKIKTTFMEEVDKFEKTLEKGLREFAKVIQFVHTPKLGQKDAMEFSGKTAFRLYETYGFPLEFTQELCAENNLMVNLAEYDEAKTKHAQLSQTASAGAFKGGLADTSGETTKLHTVTHILLSVLRKMFGDVKQKGSNITPERLRFDFTLDHKMTDEEIKKAETLVNEIIAKNLAVTCREMPIKDAEALGAIGTFVGKYGDLVKVYSVGEGDHCCSRELCGGPHVTNTSELGTFKITKEESAGAGIRRIKATLH